MNINALIYYAYLRCTLCKDLLTKTGNIPWRFGNDISYKQKQKECKNSLTIIHKCTWTTMSIFMILLQRIQQALSENGLHIWRLTAYNWQK